jgi:glycosyltransferase involved in cell wall biosynthesis
MMNRTTREGGGISDAVQMPPMSVIIPAFNEAGYIPETLDRLGAAEQHFKAVADASVEILVVDNASTDRTAELARSAGATVVHEAEHNIARVRNAGAAVALHDVLVFIDADTMVPPELLFKIARAMTNRSCAGGAVDAVHRPKSLLLRAYFKVWRVIGLVCGMAQGACQFCRRSLFQELGGYDETQFMGEDVDFYWRLKRLARKRGLRTSFIRELQVIPSPRRFDRWPLWRTLIWTFPPLVFALRRRRAAWVDWYREPPR